MAKKIPINNNDINDNIKTKEIKKDRMIFAIVCMLIIVMVIVIICTNTNNISFINVKQCEEGYTKVDDYCEKTITTKVEQEIYCSNDNYSYEGNTCVTYTAAYFTQNCPSGYVLWTGSCKKIGTKVDFGKCMYNYTYDSSTNTCYPKIDATTTYSCYKGVLEGMKCKISDSSLIVVENNCDSEYEYNSINNTCEKVIKKDLDGNEL